MATVTTAKKIGRYVITKELGRGSTSAVYLAHDPFRGSDVALKIYHGDEIQPDRADTRRKLFYNEAELAGELNHPNLLPVLEAGEADGHAFIVTKYLRNSHPLSWHTRLDDLLPLPRVVEMIFACAKALDYAHKHGVVHRDIKPSNILINEDGIPIIIDFGVAIMAEPERKEVRGLVGSPSYMAPEQAKNGDATPLTDIYALGVVAYELLTGKRPFYAESLSQLVHHIIYSTPQPIHRLRSSVPPALEQVVNKAMEKKPPLRYQSGLALAAELARVLADFEQLADNMNENDRFDMIRHLPFFADFGYGEIWETTRLSRWENFAEGETITAEGGYDNGFHIVLSGEIAMERKGKRLSILRRGECFGEMSLIQEKPRQTSVVAASDVLLLQIDKNSLEAASPGCQLAFHRQFNRALIKRVAELKESLLLERRRRLKLQREG